MKTIKPADGRRLHKLLYRLGTLRRCDVKIQLDQIEALQRVVDILLAGESAAERERNKNGPPPGFGRMSVASAAHPEQEQG